MRREVFCRTSFVAFHHWPQAPEEAEFLRHPHRHVFHVELGIEVSHSDRDVEFISLKDALDGEIEHILKSEDTSTWSCEMWAGRILAWCENTMPSYCTVSEDGENGATVIP